MQRLLDNNQRMRTDHEVNLMRSQILTILMTTYPSEFKEPLTIRDIETIHYLCQNTAFIRFRMILKATEFVCEGVEHLKSAHNKLVMQQQQKRPMPHSVIVATQSEPKKPRLDFQQVQPTVVVVQQRQAPAGQAQTPISPTKSAPRAIRTQPPPKKVPDLLKKAKQTEKSAKMIKEANKMLEMTASIKMTSATVMASKSSDIFATETVPHISLSPKDKTHEKTVQSYMQPSASKSAVQIIMDQANKTIELEKKIKLADTATSDTPIPKPVLSKSKVDLVHQKPSDCGDLLVSKASATRIIDATAPDKQENVPRSTLKDVPELEDVPAFIPDYSPKMTSKQEDLVKIVKKKQSLKPSINTNKPVQNPQASQPVSKPVDKSNQAAETTKPRKSSTSSSPSSVASANMKKSTSDVAKTKPSMTQKTTKPTPPSSREDKKTTSKPSAPTQTPKKVQPPGSFSGKPESTATPPSPTVEAEIFLIIDSEEDDEDKRQRKVSKINKRAKLRDELANISQATELIETDDEALSTTDDPISQFVVRKIVNSRVLDGVDIYKCRYVGLTDKDDQWHNFTTMEGSSMKKRELIRKYNIKRKKKDAKKL